MRPEMIYRPVHLKLFNLLCLVTNLQVLMCNTIVRIDIKTILNTLTQQKL